MPTPGEITMLLQQADQGDTEAMERLYRLVQEDLKAIAKKRRRNFPSGLDASTTLLVDEAFCRLVGQNAADWQPGDRRKFFSYVATKVHNYLVNTLQADQAQKRPQKEDQVDWEKAEGHVANKDSLENVDLMLDLQSALDRFHEFAEADADLFRIRYFLGCTFQEAADIMGISLTQAKQRFANARLWLQKELKSYQADLS